ncbi:hypothetical protein GOBAR_DD18611 [Gossypium barbadense]|nr:hypothetical protein GOBAR_DD18611 [Gossypium barbadense]
MEISESKFEGGQWRWFMEAQPVRATMVVEWSSWVDQTMVKENERKWRQRRGFWTSDDGSEQWKERLGKEGRHLLWVKRVMVDGDLGMFGGQTSKVGSMFVEAHDCR